jgi:hypothetical protein
MAPSRSVMMPSIAGSMGVSGIAASADNTSVKALFNVDSRRAAVAAFDDLEGSGMSKLDKKRGSNAVSLYVKPIASKYLFNELINLFKISIFYKLTKLIPQFLCL